MVEPSRNPAPVASYHEPLRWGGRVHDLAHLDPFVFEASSDKVPRPLRVNVRFTSHCFTEAFDATRHRATEPPIMDGARRRAFAPERYALSHRLPTLVRGLARPGVKVWETAARRNWMFSALVEVPGEGARYQVFFDLRRTGPERRHLQDLDMVVESAYPADPSRPEPNILGRVGFLLLVGSTYLGQRVTTRR